MKKEPLYSDVDGAVRHFTRESLDTMNLITMFWLVSRGDVSLQDLGYKGSVKRGRFHGRAK